MKFEFIAKHRGIWPVSWICGTLGVSRSGFHAWLVRAPSARARNDEEFAGKIRASFVSSYRTYGARRVWHDLLAEGLSCGLHRIERLMRLHGLKARPRRRGLPKDVGERSVASLAWFGLIALFMFGTMMGDCFPEMGHPCPTDHERNVTLLKIFFGGTGIYLLIALAITRFGSRRDTDD